MSVKTFIHKFPVDNVIIKPLVIFLYDENETLIKQIISMPSQIGCANHCDFCISKDVSLIRNLNAQELLDIYNSVERHTEHVELSFTGEGEPFHNIKNINQFLQKASGIENVKISFSGLGSRLISKIEIPYPVTLQFSLHNAIESERRLLIPKTDTLEIIKENLIKYSYLYEKININYVLMKDKNDSADHMEKLYEFASISNWTVIFNPQLGLEDISIPQPINSYSNIKIYYKIAQSIKNNNLYSEMTYASNVS